jgi:hypothetical protein
MVRAGVQEVVCVIMWFVRFRVVRMAVMVLFGVRRVRSGCGFRCIGRVTFRCGRRCSVPRGFSVSGVRVGCWFRVCRFVFLIRGGGSSSGCFVGCGSSFRGCCSVGFPPRVLRRPGEPAPPNPLQCVFRQPCASLRQSHAGRLLLRSAIRSERAFTSATPVTRIGPSNAHFGWRLSAAIGRAGTLLAGSNNPFARLLRPGRSFGCAPRCFARAQLALRGVERPAVWPAAPRLFVVRASAGEQGKEGWFLKRNPPECQRNRLFAANTPISILRIDSRISGRLAAATSLGLRCVGLCEQRKTRRRPDSLRSVPPTPFATRRDLHCIPGMMPWTASEPHGMGDPSHHPHFPQASVNLNRQRIKRQKSVGLLQLRSSLTGPAPRRIIHERRLITRCANQTRAMHREK